MPAGGVCIKKIFKIIGLEKISGDEGTETPQCGMPLAMLRGEQRTGITAGTAERKEKKMNQTFKKLVIAVAVVAAVGVGVNAFAAWGTGWGRGWGGHMMGPGYGPGGCGGYGPVCGAAYSPESYADMEGQYRSFFEETAETRDRLYEKTLALRSELAKADPDTAKASEIQKEISRLQAELDEKWVAHMVEIRRKYPEAGWGTWGRGPVTGYGPRGYCRR